MNCFYCDTQMSDRMYVIAGYSVCGECKKEKEEQEVNEMKKFIESLPSGKPVIGYDPTNTYTARGADKYDDV